MGKLSTREQGFVQSPGSPKSDSRAAEIAVVSALEWPAEGLPAGQAGGALGHLCSLPFLGVALPCAPSVPLAPTAANMNLDRIGEQAEAMFGVG